MAAAMYSSMASCKKNKINEFEWLKDVFERILVLNIISYSGIFTLVDLI